MSNRWLETLTEKAPVGIFRTDAAGHCHYVNQRWRDIAGLSLEEALGDGWTHRLHPEDREEVIAAWHDATAQGRSFRAEYRFLSPVGKITWVIGEANTVYSETDHLLGYVGTITDITANKNAEHALKGSEERLRSIITHMPVILDAFDADGMLCTWNKQGERVSGYSASELVGNPKAMELLYPDAEYLQTMMAAWKERGDDYIGWEWDLTAKDGTVKTVSWSNISRRFPIAGWATWGIGVEVTARKLVEKNLHERLKELSCLYELSNLISRQFTTSAALLQQAVALLPPAFQYPKITCSRIVFMENQYQSLSFRETAWRLSSALVVRNKRLGLVEVFYTEPVKELDEGPFLWEERLLLDEFTCRLAEAIEQQWARQDELLIAELGAKTEELEQFAHTISHDLKTPLTTIGGFARRMQKLLNRGEIPRASLQLERILKISDRMEQRLDDLLHLAKTGHIVKPAVAVSLKEVILDAVTNLEEKLAQRGVEVEVAPEFPLVLCDPGRLREVLENLVDNAIKYMGEQKAPRIEIGVRYSAATPVFFVRDNGMGIAAENLEKVFDLFVQLHPGCTGAGAGLAIAKRITEALNGRLWVESAGLGQGACFCFTLPAVNE